MLKTLRFIFAFSLLLFFQQRIFAAVEPYQNFLKGTIKVGDSVLVKDEKFKNPAFNWSEITNISVKNSITLQILDEQNISQSFSCKIKFRVEYFSSPTQTEPTRIDSAFLVVNYDKKAGATYKATDTYSFEDGYYVKVYVVDINSPEYGNQLPPVLQLTNQINIDRTYAFKKYLFIGINGEANQGSSGGGIFQRISTTSTPTNNGNQLALSWSTVIGAQEYDIEWVPLDADGDFGQMAADLKNGSGYYTDNQIAQMFRNNATRITTHENNYTISLIYNSNYIAVRMRQVAYTTDGLRNEGDWFYKQDDNTTYAVWDTPWHQDNLNWQYSAAYAEEGKKKEVVSYFDGTLRNRQTATLNNSDNVAVVQENIYDTFGRPTASILPAPVKENIAVQYLHYFPSFNKNASGTASYSFADLNRTNCEITPSLLSTTSGAASYYSNQNQFLAARPYNAYIPDAGGYPLSLTQYTPDNTGRIAIQGGVGQIFQPGQSEKHTTRYFYDKPSQWELDRLFGNDVGYAEHYLKNTVIDPNGQMSVSYLNASGKTIATALAGEKPDNVDALPNVPSSQQVNISLLNPNQFSFSYSNLNLSATASYTASFTGQATISYDIEKLISRYPGTSFQPYSNAYYDLAINVKDDCGNTIYPTTTPIPVIPIGSKTSDANGGGMATGSLIINFNKIGTYYITFDLKLNKDVIENYTKDYIAAGEANGTLQKKQFFVLKQLDNTDFTGCFSDCKTARQNLGTQAEFTAMFNTRLDSLGEHDNLAGYANYISGLYTSLSNYISTIEAACISAPASPCDVYRKPMLADVSPGGQYAPLNADGSLSEPAINVLQLYFKHGVFDSPPTIIGSDFYVTREDGSTASPYDSTFTLADLVKYWQPIWAEQFLPYHPERCKLLFCEQNSASKIWDNQLEEKNAATAGYSYSNASDWLLNADPFFNGNGAGSGEKIHMAADLASYSNAVLGYSSTVKSLSQTVDFLLYCADTSANTNTSNNADNWTNCSPNASCRVSEREWAMYRSMYLDLKNKYFDKVRKASTCSGICDVGTPVKIVKEGTPAGEPCASKTFLPDAIQLSSTSYRTLDYTNNLQATYSYVAGTAGSQPSASAYCTSGTATMQFYPCIDVQYLSNTIRYTNVWQIVCNETIPNSCSNPSIITADGSYGTNQFFIDWGSFRSVYTIIEGYTEGNMPIGGCGGPEDFTPYFYNCLTVNSSTSVEPINYSNVWVFECVTYYTPFGRSLAAKSSNAKSGSATENEVATPTPHSAFYYVLGDNIVTDSVHTVETALTELQIVKNPNRILEADVTKGAVYLISKVNPEELTLKGDTATKFNASFGAFKQVDFFTIKKGKGAYRSFQNVWVAKFKPQPGSIQARRELFRIKLDSVNAIQNPAILAVKTGTTALKTMSLKSSVLDDPTTDLGYMPDCRGTDFEIAGSAGTCFAEGTTNPGRKYIIYLANGISPCHQANLRVSIMVEDTWFNQQVGVDNIQLDPNTNTGSICIPEMFFSGRYSAPFVCGLLNCDTGPTPNPCEIYLTKTSRFENVDYTPPAINDPQYAANVQSDFSAQLTDICSSNADALIEKLATGLAPYTSLIPQLKANLIEFCSRSGDLDHPFGADGIAAGKSPLTINTIVCHTIAEVIKATLGINAFNNNLNPWLLDGITSSSVKQQATDMIISATTPDICAKIASLTTAANGQPLFSYLQSTYGTAMTLTQGALDTLITGCSNCKYLLQKDIQLPVFLQPKAQGCISRAEYNAAVAQMNVFFESTPDPSWSNYETILANFMNGKFGFVMGYDQYKDFANSPLVPMLCNEPPFISVPEDVYACTRSLINVAFGQGAEQYDHYIAEERTKFINAYVNTAASAKANVHLLAEQQLYHFTLYYYDLAGNLVRTVPPEGVVLLNDSEILEVDRTRDGLVNESCNYNGPATASERNTALLSLSTALQGSGNNAVEMWLYAGNPGIRQFIAATPDMKYMIQACQNGNLVNVDIFTLNQTAANNVAITLSNHVTADVSSILPLQPWSHLVVQGADLGKGALQIWINGKQYTPVTGAPSAGCPWAITTDASGNVVMPDNFALLKYLRVYNNRLLNGDEIAKNANSPCFGVVDQANPYQYRFNVPNAGDPTTIAANSTQETQFNGVYPPHVLTTTYTYNATNQVVIQNTPDAGTSKFWYDRLSRLIGSQNAKQALSGDYSYTKYDLLGRITEVGQKHTTLGVSPGYLSDSQMNAFLSAGTNSQITTTVYDAASTITGSASGLTQQNLRKRVAASIYRENYSDTNFSASYYNYDFAGNVKNLYQQVKGLGIKRLDYEYDLVSGKVNFLAYQHGASDQFYYQYEYDAENRLTKAWSAVQASVASYGFGSTLTAPNRRLNASYQYYLHGPLARMELGNEGALVQGVDYAYTLQGWLKGVNGNTLNTNDIGNDGAEIAKDALAYSLGYYQGDYTPIGVGAAFNYTHQGSNSVIAGRNLYNGNISNATYAIAKINNGATVGYTYGYDQLNRLKNVNLQALSGNNNWSFDASNQAFKESFNYDANGNILSLNRYDQNGVVMDNLTYNYSRDANGRLQDNKLTSVSNSASTSTSISTSTYTYDAIGNLLSDAAEGVSDIQWSVYGKIKQVTKNSGNLVYNYDASGNRISKTANGLTTYYVRDAQGNALAVYDVPSSGGQVVWREQDLYGSSRLGMWKPNINLATQSGGNVWGITGNISYELSNHLGNILATISDNRLQVSGGYEADVLTAGDYYAFGMAMKGRDFTNTGASAYRYGFNGKENDPEVNGQQDYGMRIYDSRLGRFKSVDPLQKDYPWYTPYQFAGNTPIQATDLDGLEEYHYTLSFNKQGKPQLKYSYTVQEKTFLFFFKYKPIETKIVTYKGEDYAFTSGGYSSSPTSDWGANSYENLDSWLKNGYSQKQFGQAFYSDYAKNVMDAGGFTEGIATDIAVGKSWAKSNSHPAEENTPTGLANKQATAANGGNTNAATANSANKDWAGPVDYSGLKEPNKVGPGMETTATQRQRILDYNKKMNGGVLRSDEDGSIINKPTNVPKGGKSDMKQAEVDHIQERSNGGSNSNKNLRVVSKEQNLKKESQRRKP